MLIKIRLDDLMDKRSVLVVSFAILLLFSFRGYAEPTWSNAINTTQSNYDPNYFTTFNVTWVNGTATSTVNTSQVFIELNYTGSPVNYSMNLISGDDFNGNYGFQEILGTGTYNWKSCAIDNETKENCTGYYYFTIDKALPDISLLLNGNANNTTLDRYIILNSTAQTIPLLTVNIYSNMSGWNEPSNNTIVYNTTNLTQLGIFNLTAYTLGNVNYSANSKTYYINVSEIAPQYSNNNVSDNIYSPGKSYQFNITWQDGSLGNVTFNIYNTSVLSGNTINSTFNSVLNSSNLINYTIDSSTKTFSVSMSDLPVGSYNYTWTAFGTSGQNNSISNTFSVSQNQTIFTIFAAVSSWTIYTSQTMTITCAVNNPIKVNIYINGTKVTNDPTVTATTTYSSTSPIEVPCYCSATGNDNYTSVNSLTNTIRVQATSSSQQPSPSSPTGPSTPSGSFIIKDLTSALTILTDESKSTSFTLSDTLSNNIANVTISVSGINSSWYTLSKNSISILKRNVPETMSITFKIPSNAEAKDYDVTITAKGKALGETSSRTATKTMKLTVNSSQPQPIQPLPSVTETPQPQLATVQQNETANITSNQTSVVTGLAPAFEFFKSNLVIILAVAACLLIFMFRNNLTAALGGTIGKEEPEKTHKSASPLKGLKDKLNYKLIVNLKKESKAKSLKETTEVQDTKVPEAISEKVPEKETKRPAILEKEIKRDIRELQGILDAEKKVGKNKKKFGMNNN